MYPYSPMVAQSSILFAVMAELNVAPLSDGRISNAFVATECPKTLMALENFSDGKIKNFTIVPHRGGDIVGQLPHLLELAECFTEAFEEIPELKDTGKTAKQNLYLAMCREFEWESLCEFSRAFAASVHAEERQADAKRRHAIDCFRMNWTLTTERLSPSDIASSRLAVHLGAEAERFVSKENILEQFPVRAARRFWTVLAALTHKKYNEASRTARSA